MKKGIHENSYLHCITFNIYLLPIEVNLVLPISAFKSICLQDFKLVGRKKYTFDPFVPEFSLKVHDVQIPYFSDVEEEPILLTDMQIIFKSDLFYTKSTVVTSLFKKHLSMLRLFSSSLIKAR